MKKRICLLLSTVLIVLLCGNTAFASISVSWENGILTVSTTDTRGMNVVYIDGQATGIYVGDTSPVQTFSVPADGKTHTVTTVAYWGASGGSATFVAAKPTKAPTATPTAKPDDPTPAPVEPTEEPAEPTAAPDPTDVPVDPTAVPGPTDGPVEPTAIPDPTDVPVEPTAVPGPTAAPADPTAVPNEPTPKPTAKPAPSYTVNPTLISDRYGNLLINAKHKSVPYMIIKDQADAKKLVIVAANSDYKTVTEIRMNLTADVVNKIRRDGYTSISYVNDIAVLNFSLDSLRNTVFEENSAANGTYILTTDPYADNGCLVKVNGVTSEGKGTAAKQFGPMELIWNGRKMKVTENGIYTLEQFTDWATSEE